MGELELEEGPGPGPRANWSFKHVENTKSGENGCNVLKPFAPSRSATTWHRESET